MRKEIQLDPSWYSHLKSEFEKPYMAELRNFLIQERRKGKEIYPPSNTIFAALNCTPFNALKVVILGQDPYHGPGQAHGLCFSVQQDMPIPPSLVNIYKELATDMGIAPAQHGNLIPWTRQGILLLNAVLTVEKHQAASHRGRGWETFTDKIIQIVNSEKNAVAFILWGAYAQKKGAFIDRNRHLVIESPHPSPLSASRGFFGSRPFSQVNRWLEQKGLGLVDWSIPSPIHPVD